MIPSAAGHWLLGSAREMAAAAHRFPAELGWKHGGLARFRLLHKSLLAVTDPDYVQQVLVTHHERYQRSFQYRNQQAVVGKGLISTDGDGWLKRRRQALPAFRIENVKRVVPATAAATHHLLERWESSRRRGEPVLIVSDMRRLAMSVIGRALLSTDLVEEDAIRFGQAVADALQLVRERNTSAFNAPLSFPTRHNRRLRETRNILDRYVNGHLDRRRHGGRHEDILDALLQARDPDTGEALGRQALLDETKTLFVAGFETTATALAWMLYLLARNTAAAERWHDEVDRVCAGSSPTWDDLEKLTWTNQIINEAMRVYPPVYNMARQCISDDVIDGQEIRRGMLLLISIFGIHRREESWPDAGAFRPERFDPGSAWPRNAFLPFGAGKHICIGASFALTEIKVILAIIGQRYRLEPVEQAEVGEIARITLAPSREIPLRLIART
jgi:cytochrome P450